MSSFALARRSLGQKILAVHRSNAVPRRICAGLYNSPTVATASGQPTLFPRAINSSTRQSIQSIQSIPVQPRWFSSLPLADGADEARYFQDLHNLNPNTLQALDKKGLQTMTEIQAKTWDAVHSGNDVVGRSRTGSGKVSSGTICLYVY